MTHTVEDSLVLFRVVCAQDFNMGDSCKLVCVVALLVIIMDNFFFCGSMASGDSKSVERIINYINS